MTRPTGTPFVEICAEAVANLRGQGRRSLLALLGIVIGSASIIALLSLGHIAQLEMLKRFQQMGVEMVQVQTIPTGDAPSGFARELVETLPRTDPDVAQALPMALGRQSVVHGPLTTDAQIAAVTPELNQVAGLRPASGRLLAPLDACVDAVVVGAVVAQALSTPGAALRPGQRVSIGDYGYIVVGVLQPILTEPMSPVDYDRAVLLSLPCSRRVLPGPDPTAALIRMRPGADADALGARLTTRLSNPASTVQVINARSMIESMKQQNADHSRLLAAIGAISLLVGGIGVMNVMLMTVMERRREIGLRAAVGATPGDIRLMFLIEGAMLSVGGGVLGLLLGILATLVFAAISKWTFVLALWVIPLGPAMAGLVGVAFALYPAITASRIDPIEALRAE